MFCLIFGLIRVFCLFQFGLFIYFCLAFFSALFVLLVVYAAPSGGVWCGRVVRHLLCGRGAKHVAIWSTWRRLMRFLFDSGSSPPSLPLCQAASSLGHTHSWLTPIPKRLSLSLSVCRLKLCVKIVWLNNFGTCPARCTLIALHTSLLRQRRSRCRSWRRSRLGLPLGAGSLHMAPHLVGHLRNSPRCLPH